RSCRGELLSRAFAQSWAESPATLIRNELIAAINSATFKPALLLILLLAFLSRFTSHFSPVFHYAPRFRRATSTHQRINAPPSRPVKHHEEKHPAIKHRELSLVRDREDLRHRGCGMADMKHEIGDGHLAAEDES